MRVIFRLATVAALLLMLAACAAPSHRVALNAEPAVSSVDFGQGRSLNLVVRDTRERSHFGRPRQGEGGDAIIYSEQNVAELLTRGLSSGFRAKGFTPQPAAQLGRRGVQVELRLLERNIEGNEFVAEAHIEVVAVNEAGEPGRRYRSQYRARSGERRPVDNVQVSERVLNAALNQALGRMLEDEKLLEFLAR